jgi:hypothetical protein
MKQRYVVVTDNGEFHVTASSADEAVRSIRSITCDGRPPVVLAVWSEEATPVTA